MNTERNTVRIDDIPGQPVFKRFLLAVQKDLLRMGSLFQQPSQAEFPEIPYEGGMFYTRKGAYEAIFLDPASPGDEEQPRWRRLSDGSTYEQGATIPTTL